MPDQDELSERAAGWAKRKDESERVEHADRDDLCVPSDSDDHSATSETGERSMASADSVSSSDSEPSERSAEVEQAVQSEKSDINERGDSDVRSERSAPSESDALSEAAKQDDPDEPSASDEHGEQLRNPDNVKEAWDGGYYYIPPDISGEADEAFARLQYECRAIDVKKNRHFNVVLVLDGLRAIQEMDGDDFKDRLDELGLR